MDLQAWHTNQQRDICKRRRAGLFQAHECSVDSSYFTHGCCDGANAWSSYQSSIVNMKFHLMRIYSIIMYPKLIIIIALEQTNESHRISCVYVLALTIIFSHSECVIIIFTNENSIWFNQRNTHEMNVMVHNSFGINTLIKIYGAFFLKR